MLGLTYIQPARLAATHQLRFNILRQADIEPRMGAGRGIPLVAGLQSLDGKLAQRFEHRVARCRRRPPDSEQACLDQVVKQIPDVAFGGWCRGRFTAEHGGRGHQREPADEDAQPSKQILAVGVQQTQAPLDCGPQRTVARLLVQGTIDEDLQSAALMEELRDAARLESVAAGRRKLDGERDAVQLTANLEHAIGIARVKRELGCCVANAIDEQLNGWLLRHGLEIVARHSGWRGTAAPCTDVPRQPPRSRTRLVANTFTFRALRNSPATTRWRCLGVTHPNALAN